MNLIILFYFLDGAYDVYKNLLVSGENAGPGFMWAALLKWDTKTFFGYV
jgi:hypothetical protein